jgi:hypothetical protein
MLSIVVALFVYALKGGTISCYPEKPPVVVDPKENECASRFN